VALVGMKRYAEAVAWTRWGMRRDRRASLARKSLRSCRNALLPGGQQPASGDHQFRGRDALPMKRDLYADLAPRPGDQDRLAEVEADLMPRCDSGAARRSSGAARQCPRCRKPVRRCAAATRRRAFRLSAQNADAIMERLTST